MLDSLFPEYGSGCVIKVAKKDGSDFSIKTYVQGNRTLDPTKEPIMEDTLFDIASLTKTVTAILVHQAVELGYFTYETPIAQIDPCFKRLSEVTILDLLAHRVELWTDGYLGSACSKEQFYERLWSAYVKRNHPHYTDLHYMVLSRVLETCYQQPYQTIVEEKICRPLHLTHTSFVPNRDLLASSDGEWINGEPSNTDAVPHDPKARVALQLGLSVGHAGLFTTAQDYLTILLALVDGKERLLKQKTLDFFFSHGDYQAYLMEELHVEDPRALSSIFETDIGRELLPTLMKPYTYGGMRYKIDNPYLDPIPFPVSPHTYLFSGYTGPLYLIDLEQKVVILLMINSCYHSKKTRQERLQTNLNVIEELYQREM